MTVFTVANQAQLLSALASAEGGDTIALEDGHYGSMRISDDFASNVTIRSEKPLGATISNLELFGASNLTFDGINFASGGNGGHGRGIVSIERQAENIAIVNSEVHGNEDGNYSYLGHYGLYVRESDNIKLQSNNIHDVSCGIVVFGTTGSSLKGNTIDYIGHDAMKLGGLHHTEIVDNRHLGHHYPQPATVHADFIQFQGSSADVHIEGNVYLAQTTAWLQGIFANNGVYENFTVENNIIHTGMMRGISFSEGSGIVIRNNTVLHTANDGHPETKIFAPAGSIVENNITATKATGGTRGSNITLQITEPGEPYYVEDHFVNGAAGKGLDLADLRPVKGSLAETSGAAARLKELLGDTPAPEKPIPWPADYEVAINAGGGATGDFGKDAGFTGGAAYATREAIARTTADVLYQTVRFGNFNYGSAVANGDYAVTLKFAEIYHNAPDKRLFDVEAEGELVLDNVDVFRMAGGKNKAWDATIEVEVADGRLELDFISVKNYANVSAIEIAPVEADNSTLLSSNSFDVL